MKTFNTFDAFAKHINKLASTYALYEKKAAIFVGHELVKEAQDSIGHIQDGAGPFETWSPLAESTKADKERLGYVFNADYNPLLRTGEMRDSIDFDFVASKGYSKLRLGAKSEIMVYQELGTARIPPRSVLGMTMFKSQPVISYAMIDMLTSWIEGKTLKPRRKTLGSI